ncbi:unnamed protein product [marine sediment metagenome]|uniref:Uncharacterized protein n=1 Tax=marine sediment metagenome TaxID=412755 RepID=X1GYE5_9ZZZZ
MGIPENINFCLFAECHYLEGEECTVEECIYNAKWVAWWVQNQIMGRFVHSIPPEGKKAVKNIYYDPDKKKYTMVREE